MPHLFGYQFLDNSGDPLASGKITTYLAGGTTPSATYPTYDDAVAGTNALANPVVLDSAGRQEIWMKDFAMKVKIDTSADVTLETIDDIYGSGGITTASDDTIDITILADNDANALVIKESSNNYLRFDTTDTSEALHFGNATQNTDFNFLGTGTMSLGTAVDISFSDDGGPTTLTSSEVLNITTTSDDIILTAGSPGDIDILAADDIDIDSGGTITIDTTSSGNIEITSDYDVSITASHQLVLTATSSFIRIANDTRFQDAVYVQERASADIDVTAYGQLWIKSDTPNVLMFTDDAGTDYTVDVTAV